MHLTLQKATARVPVVAAIGDSHTFNTSWLTRAEYYTHRLAERLGYAPVNRGVSGNSTAQVYNRRRQLLFGGNPDVVVIYAGTNDINADDALVLASPAPTSTVFSLDTDSTYHAADGWITVGGELAQVLSVNAAEITLTAPLAGGAPAAGTSVLIATQVNLEATITYLKQAGVSASSIYVMGQHYTNFSVNGDTTSAEVAWAATLRDIQEAAAVAQGVNYVDTYAFMRQLIVDEVYTQGDALWHVADLDTHLNAIGEQILADCLFAAVS